MSLQVRKNCKYSHRRVILIMLTFEEYINGYIHKPDYDKEEVKKRFYQVIDILGKEDKNALIASITIRLMNKINGVPTDWIIANKVSNALSILISKRFWGKRSKYKLMPYVSSIESSKNWDKEHLHILIKISDLRERLEEDEIDRMLRSICYSLDEVNNKTPDAVKIRIYPYLETPYKIVGNAIHYICKSSINNHKRVYNPLLRKLKDGRLINQ